MESLFRTFQGEGPNRLDAFVAWAIDEISREYAKDLIVSGQVRVNGREGFKPSYKLHDGDIVEVVVPDPAPMDCLAEPIPLEVVYEDDHILVIVKPRGMVCHPVGPYNSGTLVNALLHHCQVLSGIRGEARPGIVHRLDRDTTGLLVVAKSDRAHHGLGDQFRARSMVKVYLALVRGYFPSERGVIEIPLARDPKMPNRMRVDRRGKEAITSFERLVVYGGKCSLLKLQIHTGRTHQIRVHAAHLGHPVVGDEIYGNPAHPETGFSGLALHAWRLQFRHPITKERMNFAHPLPEDFRQLLRHVRAGGRV